MIFYDVLFTNPDYYRSTVIDSLTDGYKARMGTKKMPTIGIINIHPVWWLHIGDSAVVNLL